MYGLGVAAWQDRSAEFGELCTYEHEGRLVPAMELVFAGEGWKQLRELWSQRVPEHPHILEAIGVRDDRLVLRYAAINWSHPRFAVPTQRALIITLLRWGAQIADLYSSLLRSVTASDLARFTNPFALIDLGEDVRLGFQPSGGWTDRMAPEVRNSWPRCDEAALVYTVGQLLLEHVGAFTHNELWSVIERCREPKPRKRYRTLEDVRNAFTGMVSISEPVRGGRLVPWQHVEEGIGWLQLGDAQRAYDQFRTALQYNSYRELAEKGHEVTLERLRPGWAARRRDLAPSPPAANPKRPRRSRGSRRSVDDLVSWANAEPEALRLELQRDFLGALAVYWQVAIDDTNRAHVFTAMSRAHLESGDLDHAIDCAKSALEADDGRVAARVVLVKALLAKRDHSALAEADRLVLQAADDPTHHYLRGKALLALSRLDEARDVFDLVCRLRPTMLEAMLLRREVDRCITANRKRIGTQGPITFEIPDSLVELRDVLVSGHSEDAIAMLSESRFADDADAQLVLAHMLAFDRKLQQAAEIYDRVALMPDPHRHNALVGKARVMLELGHLDSALALFDQACSEKPTDLEASEGRATTLERIGRTDEAAAEYRRFVDLATSRSDVRVRAAQIWLDAHAGSPLS